MTIKIPVINKRRTSNKTLAIGTPFTFIIPILGIFFLFISLNRLLGLPDKSKQVRVTNRSLARVTQLSFLADFVAAAIIIVFPESNVAILFAYILMVPFWVLFPWSMIRLYKTPERGTEDTILDAKLSKTKENYDTSSTQKIMGASIIDSRDMYKKTLDEKIWYRGLKVVFVLVFLLTQGVGLILAQEVVSEKIFYVKCDNGKELKPTTLSFDSDKMKLDLFKQCDIAAYFLGKSELTGILTEIQRKQISSTILEMESKSALESEIQQVVDDFKQQYAVPNTDHRGYTTAELSKLFGHDFSDTFKVKDSNWVANFTIQNKDKYNLATKAGYYIFTFVIICVIFWFIRRIFFYVIVKENFFRL